MADFLDLEPSEGTKCHSEALNGRALSAGNRGGGRRSAGWVLSV